ncbi:MAG: amidohydrolase [Bacteroidales bacterium]|jgi:predicted amidohydrolase YtcJ|nr:amidohydrolase [Bacteroidales bacterium]
MQKTHFYLLIIILGVIPSCSSQKKVDLIVINTNVYTVNEEFAVAEAFAVDDGKFVAVGTSEEISSQFQAEEILDLNGQFVYPGFIDAHAHFFGYGKGIQTEAQLYETQSEEEILNLLDGFQEDRQNAWILGRGWDQNDWSSLEFPNKNGLDILFPETPVYLTRIDGHAAWVNSKALELAGINSKTYIEGGDIILQNGEPSGILIDNAMSLVRSLIPELTKSAQIKALKAAEKNCFAVGLTGVTDAGLSLEAVQLVDSLHKSNGLSIRINAMLNPSEENFNYFLPNGPYITDKLSVRTIKIYADGALGSRGACMIEPYSDSPNNYGLMIKAENYYREICAKAIEHNYQVATHAIGDSANRVMLRIYGEALKEKNDKRWRIEHAQIIAPEDFELFGKYSIIPSVQPTHATSDMYWADERVGLERLKGGYAYKQLLDQNNWIPLGTDFPIEKVDPLLTFYAAVVRKDLNNYPSEGFQIENALSREETLKGMTIWAAKTAFEENVKGSIEKGKFADFVVLNQDIMECNDADIPSTEINYTVVGGEILFKRD